MSDLSDIEILDEIGKNLSQSAMDEVYENCIEEVVIGSSSEEEKEYQVFNSPIHTSPKTRYQNKDLQLGYNLLHTAIKNSDSSILPTKSKRMDTVICAISLCEQLVTEEKKLKIESEELFQKHWRLKQRIEVIEKLKRKKKRKEASGNTKNVIGEDQKKCHVSPQKKTPSMDASQVKVTDLPEKNNEVEIGNNSGSTDRYKNPKRRAKKVPSGLTEEERKFLEIQEKIEDLLFEVDVLWNEVKDESEESDSEEEQCNDTFNSETESSIIPELKGHLGKDRQTQQKLSSETKEVRKDIPKLTPISQVITIKNISKLVDPQFITKITTDEHVSCDDDPTNPENNLSESDKDLPDEGHSEKQNKPTSDVIVISEGSENEM